MAISIDWGTKVISVPQADLTFVSGIDYLLDIDVFRLALKALEAGEVGMSFLDTHQHNTEAVLGGVTYARQVEIINGYTVTFENGTYRVTLTGANSNIQDVVNYNAVQTASQNSAGLVVVEVPNTDDPVVLATGTATGTPSSISIESDISQPNDYYNQYILRVEDGADTASRLVARYVSLNGLFQLAEPLPFVPSAGATLDVMVFRSSADKTFV